MPEVTEATTDCGCQPDCCSHGQKKISAAVGGHPLFDASCCPKGMALAPKAGAVMTQGQVVYFTGTDVDIGGNKYAEVDVSGDDVAGVAQWDIDNTAGDVGSTQFLVEARVFANRIDLNGATIADLKKTGLIVVNVHS